LEALRLEIHANKCQIYPTRKGVIFLGYKIFPTHLLVVKQNVKRLRKRLKKYFVLLQKGVIEKNKIICSIQSWLGYAIHADSFILRRRILAEFNFMGISP